MCLVIKVIVILAIFTFQAHLIRAVVEKSHENDSNLSKIEKRSHNLGVEIEVVEGELTELQERLLKNIEILNGAEKQKEDRVKKLRQTQQQCLKELSTWDKILLGAKKASEIYANAIKESWKDFMDKLGKKKILRKLLSSKVKELDTQAQENLNKQIEKSDQEYSNIETAVDKIHERIQFENQLAGQVTQVAREMKRNGGEGKSADTIHKKASSDLVLQIGRPQTDQMPSGLIARMAGMVKKEKKEEVSMDLIRKESLDDSVQQSDQSQNGLLVRMAGVVKARKGKGRAEGEEKKTVDTKHMKLLPNVYVVGDLNRQEMELEDPNPVDMYEILGEFQKELIRQYQSLPDMQTVIKATQEFTSFVYSCVATVEKALNFVLSFV